MGFRTGKRFGKSLGRVGLRSEKWVGDQGLGQEGETVGWNGVETKEWGMGFKTEKQDRVQS